MTDKPSVVFVNSVAVSGFLNGVCNFAFATAQFIPEMTFNEALGKEVSTGQVLPAEEITVQLRFDLRCAQQLHDSLASILAQQTKPAPKDVN